MRNYALVAALWAVALPLTPALAATRYGYAVRSTVMHAGPDFQYPAVQRVRRDAGITVYGCLRDWSWCDVSNRSARGWVAGNDIVVSYQGRRQSILPTMGIGVLSFVFGSYWDSHYRSRSFYSQRPRFEQQYNTDHRPQWGPNPGGQGNAPPRGVIRQRPTMPPRQMNPRAPGTAPQQYQPGMGQPGATPRPNRPMQRPDGVQPPVPRIAPPQREPGAMQRQNAPAQQRTAPVGPSPQGRQAGPGNGNRNNGQAPGQPRGGRPAGPQGRQTHNHRPSD